MTSIYHAGERAVQEQAGVSEMASRVGRSIKDHIPPVAQEFLMTQRMVLVGSVDGGGRVWASLLTGAPGFLRAIDEQTVQIDAAPVGGDPLPDNLRAHADVGLLAIEPATRRRMRLNGTATVAPDGSLRLRPRQVYANCPKYIQARRLEPDDTGGRGAPSIRHTSVLSDAQQGSIARADTFFIASSHPEGGADVSHRGGAPGFVRVVDAATLVFPDYAGNSMFQTLGNIAANPRTGLLFVDWEQGTTLQVTGAARIVWDAERIAHFVGAERLVEFAVEEAIEIQGGSPLRAGPVDYSPFNPS
jgi:hypothetical protein